MKNLNVSGRRWFDTSRGSTYHSVYITVDGVEHVIPYSYGYDNQWEDTAAEWLEKNGHMPEREHSPNGSKECLWRYCERMNVKYTRDVIDVKRRKEL
jgi:hypothetical protein